MRGLFLTLLCLGVFISAKAQTHELGAVLGLSNYIGDVGEMNYLRLQNPAYGIIYKYNAHERFAIRGSVIFTELKGDDSESDLPSRGNRGLSFTNNITEFNAGFEFNFREYEPLSTQPQVVPYVATGVSLFLMDYNYYPNRPGIAQKINKKQDISIPLIVGVKSNLSSSFILGFEIGARYTFSDSIDGSSFGTPIGNTNSDDWYFITGLTATFTIGNKLRNCRCPF